MELEKRLRELLENDNRGMAESLASGALGSQPPTDIELTASGVRVETKLFSGIHQVSPAPTTILEQGTDNSKSPVENDEIEIVPGEYQLKSDEVDYTIPETNVHRDKIKEYIQERFCTEPSTSQTKTVSAITQPPADSSNTTAETASASPEAQNTVENSPDDSISAEPEEEPTRIPDGGVPQGRFSRFVQACLRRLK